MSLLMLIGAMFLELDLSETRQEALNFPYQPPYETFEVTAYTLHPSETGGKKPGHPAYGITASGKPVQAKETIACDTNVLPFGTQVYVPHFDRVYECHDTGSAIKGNKIDIYFESRKKAFEFGRRALPVLVVKEAD